MHQFFRGCEGTCERTFVLMVKDGGAVEVEVALGCRGVECSCVWGEALEGAFVEAVEGNDIRHCLL